MMIKKMILTTMLTLTMFGCQMPQAPELISGEVPPQPTLVTEVAEKDAAEPVLALHATRVPTDSAVSTFEGALNVIGWVGADEVQVVFTTKEASNFLSLNTVRVDGLPATMSRQENAITVTFVPNQEFVTFQFDGLELPQPHPRNILQYPVQSIAYMRDGEMAAMLF